LELGWKGRVNIVATGGQARLIASRCPLINHTDPFLVLKGLRIIAEGMALR
jgi:pantothenate kinase type III